MYKSSEIPRIVLHNVVDFYLRAKICPMNIWFDTNQLRFYAAKHPDKQYADMAYLGKFHNISFDDLLDELMYAFQNE